MGWLRPSTGRSRVFSPHARSLTAAAQRLEGSQGNESRRLTQPWQTTAMSYYDLSGECWYAANFHGKAMSQIRIYPAVKDASGEVEETDDAEALALVDRVRDESGSTAQITGNYGRLMFLIGDGLLLATGPEQEGDVEQWEFVSPWEVKVESDDTIERVKSFPGKTKKYRSPSGDGELQKGEAMVYRFWRRHPLHSVLADAPMNPVLGLFEELLLLQASVKARIRSRLAAAGILFIPEEIDFPSPDGQADEDANADQFTKKLIEHMTRPIQNPDSASAVTPLVVRSEAEYIEAVRHLKIHDPNETYREQGLRDEAIKRIAIGLDLPAEVLLGLADSNHWTAWQIDEQVAKAHIFPACQMFCDDMTGAYLRPAARDAGIQDWENLVVAYDAADLVVHPDRSDDARELYDRRAIGKESLREAHGFDDDDAPPEEDLNEMIGLALGDAALATGQPQDQGGGAGFADQTGASATQEPPSLLERINFRERQPQQFAASGNGHFSAQILGAAEMAVERGREMAGSRLRPKVRDKSAIDGVPNSHVAAALGPEALAAIEDVTPMSLVSGAGRSFAATISRWGVDDKLADALGERVEVHAARTLCEEHPARLPKGFVASLASVQGDGDDG